MSVPELRAPGQAGSGAHLPPAAGQGVRAVLADLFPAPAEPAPRAGLARWAFLLVQVAVVALGALVMLARIGGRPAWDSVYAEDPGIYLPAALAHPWHLLQSYGGYLQLVPRLIGQIAALLPIRDASVVFAVGGALVASACGLFAYHASAGHVSSRWLRALLGLSVVLLPVAQLEIADNGVNSIWYLLVALFWAALWRPRTRAGAAVAAVVAFAAAASSSLALLFAPLFAARAIVVPRRPREHAATAGWALGCLLQVLVILTSHLSRLGPHDPVDAVLYYAHEVLLPALGWHLSWHLRDIVGLTGATALAGGFIVVVLASVLATQARAVQGVRGCRRGDRPGVHGGHLGARLGRAGPASHDHGGTRRPVFHGAHPAARCGADRGGRRLRAPVVAAPQGRRRGRRADRGPGSRLGHGLPLPGSPLRRTCLSLGTDGQRVASLLPAQAGGDDHGHLP